MTFPTAIVELDSSSIQARNFSILNQTNVHQISTRSSRRDPMEILEKNVAFGALHDSAERFDPPRCHPETRTAVLNRIDLWAQDASEDAKPVLWLTGAAGAGKSAIAQTLVERWNERGMIAVTFFFWRTSSQRNQKTLLIPTLAFQLLERYPPIRTTIEATIDSGSLFKRNLAFQLESLIVQPLLNVHERPQVIIVMDGLDECCIDLPKFEGFEGQDYESQQQEILDGVASACQKVPFLRVLIASRPERQIRESFGEGLLKQYTLALSLNNAPDSAADIQLFLECTLEEIRQRHRIESPWPSIYQILKLVEKSSGQFIYPSVALKHISRPRLNPVESLKAVLDLRPELTEKPFAELDALYTLVLKSVTTISIPVVTDVLGIIALNTDVEGIFNKPPGDKSAHLFEQFFFLTEGDVYSHLTDLHSILDIPSDSRDPIRFAHTTLSEYLQDPSRSGVFFISMKSVWCRCALFAIRHIKQCMEDKKFDMYRPYLIGHFVYKWLRGCTPRRDMMAAVWGIMEYDIGPYPTLPYFLKSLSHEHKGPGAEISAQFRANSFCMLMQEWNKFNEGQANESTWIWKIPCELVLERIIIYLQGCNIPEIESSWWRRYLIRRRLEIARFDRGGMLAR